MKFKSQLTNRNKLEKKPSKTVDTGHVLSRVDVDKDQRVI